MKRTATGNPELMTLIARIHLTWKRHLERALVGEDITLKQYHLLVQLDERPFLRPAQVAEELFCDRPTASVILRNMEKRGWISRRKDPDNGKQVRIRLLVAGRRKLADIRNLPELERRFTFDPCGGLSKKSCDELEAHLVRLMGRLERLAQRDKGPAPRRSSASSRMDASARP